MYCIYIYIYCIYIYIYKLGNALYINIIMYIYIYIILYSIRI